MIHDRYDGSINVIDRRDAPSYRCCTYATHISCKEGGRTYTQYDQCNDKQHAGVSRMISVWAFDMKMGDREITGTYNVRNDNELQPVIGMQKVKLMFINGEVYVLTFDRNKVCPGPADSSIDIYISCLDNQYNTCACVMIEQDDNTNSFIS
jgi:hypothetical protein